MAEGQGQPGQSRYAGIHAAFSFEAMPLMTANKQVYESWKAAGFPIIDASV